MKRILIALLFLTACTKEQTTSVRAGSADEAKQKTPHYTITKSCYDNSHSYYNVKVVFTGCLPSDVQVVGFHGGSNSEIVKQSGNGIRNYKLTTGEGGKKGNIYVYVVRNKNDTSFLYPEVDSAVSGIECR